MVFIKSKSYDIILFCINLLAKEKIMSTFSTILFATVIMMSYFIEGMIGFGGTIIALPLASEIAGIKMAVPVLTIVVFLASVVIAIRDFKYLDRKEFVKISLLMILGLPIGTWLFSSLPERPLKLALSVFMIVIAIKGLLGIVREKKEQKSEQSVQGKDEELELESIIDSIGDSIAENSAIADVDNDNLPLIEEGKNKTKKWLSNLTIFVGGIVHGAFSCGGPFVVVYATNNIKNKSSFRATLCTLWALLNAIMIVIKSVNGEITSEVMRLSAWTMPFVIVAIIVSNIAHKKLKGDSFTTFVYVALFVSGILMAL